MESWPPGEVIVDPHWTSARCGCGLASIVWMTAVDGFAFSATNES